MLALVTDPGFPALLLQPVLVSQAVIEKDFIDGVVRDMNPMPELNNLLQTSCAKFLLFVDFKYELFRFFVQLFLLPTGVLYWQSLSIFHLTRPNPLQCGRTKHHLQSYPFCAVVPGFLPNYEVYLPPR